MLDSLLGLWIQGLVRHFFCCVFLAMVGRARGKY